VIEKIRKTHKFREEGVDPDRYEEMGGFSLEHFQSYMEVMERRHNTFKSFIKTNREDNNRSIRSSAPIVKPDPIVGSKNALVLMVDFEDLPSTSSTQDFQKLLFSTGDYEVPSMRDYFREASWDQLDINGDIKGWYRADKKYSDYVDQGHTSENTLKWRMPKARELVKEVLIKIKESGDIQDFSKYDSNGDGKLDLLIIVYAGKGADRANYSYIYPHQSHLDPFYLQDDVMVDHYILVHEIPSYDLGTFCHEVGHSLGLPDLYTDNCTVVGQWCLMGYGCTIDDGRLPGHLSAWCKLHLGWTEPEIINGVPKSYQIPEITSSLKKIYRIDLVGSEGKNISW
jgi:immune inhibitor A